MTKRRDAGRDLDAARASGRCRVCAANGLARAFPDALPWVVRCPSCGLVFADPQPTDDALEAIYDEHYYEQFGFLAGDAEATRGLSTIKRATYDRMLRVAERHVPRPADRAPRLLDVGCGLGFSLLAAQERGFEALGLDPLAPADPATHGDRRVIRGTLESHETDARFDLVSMVDVIEHVRDPVDTVERAASLLGEGGALMLATNDVSSVGARRMGPRWTHFHRAHLYFFTPETLADAVRRAGLRVVATAPAHRVYSLQYIASILARGDNFELARRVSELALRAIPRPARELRWPPLREGFVLIAKKP